MIFGACTGWVAIILIVLGILALFQAKNRNEGWGMLLAGIILGLFALAGSTPAPSDAHHSIKDPESSDVKTQRLKDAYDAK